MTDRTDRGDRTKGWETKGVGATLMVAAMVLVALAATVLNPVARMAPAASTATPMSIPPADQPRTHAHVYTNTNEMQTQRKLPAQVGMQNDDIMVDTLRERLQQHNLTIPDDHKLPPHQFMHLHHMKTGGTSVDDLLKCSVKRMQHVLSYDAKHFSLHECTAKFFRKCVEGDERCRARLDNTTFLSYCGPLKDLNSLGWIDDPNKGTDHGTPERPAFAAVTVLRHPVERVWSNYRFATKGCYRCMELKDVYKAFEENTLMDHRMGNQSICIRQMMNQQTFRLISSKKFEVAKQGILEVSDDMRKEMVKEAIYNMENFFTMVGITEELNTFGKMLPQVFPFMAPTIPGSHRACHLPHSNRSPSNNRCGEGGAHWELPPHPDNVTRAIIEKHNKLDIELYEAAKKLFQLEKRALGFQ